MNFSVFTLAIIKCITSIDIYVNKCQFYNLKIRYKIAKIALFVYYII